jgi:hypothetical protein
LSILKLFGVLFCIILKMVDTFFDYKFNKEVMS